MQTYIEQYLNKISNFISIEMDCLKSPKLPRSHSTRKTYLEAKKILGAIRPNDFVVLCDEKGESMSTLVFSKKLTHQIESGFSRLVFVVGGPFGVTRDVRRRAQTVVSLSCLTMSHHLAIAVLLEQIYRAITIWKNLPYHNAPE